MGPVAKIATIIAITSLAATLIAPGMQTANIVKTGFNGLIGWTKVSQGR